MILIDSTVWIDYFNGAATWQTAHLDAALSEQLVLIGDIILAEVLQGFRDDSEFDEARRALGVLEQVGMLGPFLAVESARSYRRLRKMGITVRKTVDCLIATYCIANQCALLHADRDFDPFEEHLGLTVVHP
jgi:predicted nucleic acid-binding protein